MGFFKKIGFLQKQCSLKKTKKCGKFAADFFIAKSNIFAEKITWGKLKNAEECMQKGIFSGKRFFLLERKLIKMGYFGDSL